MNISNSTGNPKLELDLLNHEGKILYNGWGANMADKFTLNHKDASLNYYGK